MPPLRILTLIDTLTWGGAEMLLADFADGAPAADLELRVAYLKDIDGSPAAARLRARGIQPDHVRGTLLHDPRGLARVGRHILRTRPDVVHTHLQHADLVGSAAASLLRVPVVSTLHVMDWQGSGRQHVKHELAARARRRADRVVAVSEAARQAYLARGWDEPAHVLTVHNGTRGEVRPGAGRRVRAELGLRPGDLVVTMLAVLRAGKGHDVAAQAVSSLLGEFPDLRLLVLGEGAYRPEVERLVAGLGPAAILAGHREDVLDVLDASDVLIHPTSADALPTALIEAMAASVPSVATAVGGVPELVDDGVTGLLTPAPPDPTAFAAALRRLLEQPALRQRLGQAGRARHEQRFRADRWAQRMREVYDDVLGDRRRRSGLG